MGLREHHCQGSSSTRRSGWAAGEDPALGEPGSVSARLNRPQTVDRAINGAEPDISVPLSAVHNVAWQKGLLGNPDTLTVYTGSQAHTYKARNKEGQPAAETIRQAIAGSSS